jgi:hypothetical protein
MSNQVTHPNFVFQDQPQQIENLRTESKNMIVEKLRNDKFQNPQTGGVSKFIYPLPNMQTQQNSNNSSLNLNNQISHINNAILPGNDQSLNFRELDSNFSTLLFRIKAGENKVKKPVSNFHNIYKNKCEANFIKDLKLTVKLIPSQTKDVKEIREFKDLKDLKEPMFSLNQPPILISHNKDLFAQSSTCSSRQSNESLIKFNLNSQISNAPLKNENSKNNC